MYEYHRPTRARNEEEVMSKPLFTIGLDVQIDGIAEIAALLRELIAARRHQHQKAHLTGGSIVIIVKDNQPEVGYAISGAQASDAEGHAIPDAKLAYEVTSTDDTVVSVTPDATDPTKGTAAFGSPGLATVNVTVKAGETLLGSFAQSFTVTAGDPASISGGSIAFDGLTDNGGG